MEWSQGGVQGGIKRKEGCRRGEELAWNEVTHVRLDVEYAVCVCVCVWSRVATW